MQLCILTGLAERLQAHVSEAASTSDLTSICWMRWCKTRLSSWFTVQDGALELEGGELSFETGPDGKPSKVEGKAHLPMMAVVAEMMIFANAAVAHRIAGAFPGAALLRRHAPPSPDGFDQVRHLNYAVFRV